MCMNGHVCACVGICMYGHVHVYGRMCVNGMGMCVCTCMCCMYRHVLYVQACVVCIDMCCMDMCVYGLDPRGKSLKSFIHS